MDDKERLKELRKELGLSQVKFAERFGIPLRTIQDWEYEKREVRSYIVDMMYRIIELEKELENK
nr:MAG TPA: Regulatory protein-modification, helix-turn-helix, transcriptional regulato, DNA [Caudoviricetes sp.]